MKDLKDLHKEHEDALKEKSNGRMCMDDLVLEYEAELRKKADDEQVAEDAARAALTQEQRDAITANREKQLDLFFSLATDETEDDSDDEDEDENW